MASVRFINTLENEDPRGTLTAVEAYKETGVLYKRFFLIDNKARASLKRDYLSR